MIKVLPDNIEVQIDDKADNLLELLLNNKVDVFNSCGGNGTCGTCRVIIEENLEKLPPRNEIELEFADMRRFEKNERLCCQIKPIDGLVIRLT